MITAQDILTELGNRAWSGFNKDDMEFDKEDSLQAQAELNSAIRYLMALKDFPFKTSTIDLMVMKNMAEYSSVEGQIAKIYDEDNKNVLKFIGDSASYDKKATGTPTHFWIEYNNPDYTIRLYPIPDKKYNMKVQYNTYLPVIGQDGSLKYKFTEPDDYINMPANLEYLFMDCLIMRTMQTNNKDQQDENYAPTIDEFNEAWRNFLRLCKPVRVDTRVVW